MSKSRGNRCRKIHQRSAGDPAFHSTWRTSDCRHRMCAVTAHPVSVVGVDQEALEPHAYVAPPGDALGPGASDCARPGDLDRIVAEVTGRLSPGSDVGRRSSSATGGRERGDRARAMTPSASCRVVSESSAGTASFRSPSRITAAASTISGRPRQRPTGCPPTSRNARALHWRSGFIRTPPIVG